MCGPYRTHCAANKRSWGYEDWILQTMNIFGFVSCETTLPFLPSAKAVECRIYSFQNSEYLS
jgi:hypothetical protein